MKILDIWSITRKFLILQFRYHLMGLGLSIRVKTILIMGVVFLGATLFYQHNEVDLKVGANEAQIVSYDNSQVEGEDREYIMQSRMPAAKRRRKGRKRRKRRKKKKKPIVRAEQKETLKISGHYVYTRAKGLSSFTAKDGKPCAGCSLPEETLIRLKSKLAPGELFVDFETIPQKPNDPVISGRMPVQHIGKRLPDEIKSSDKSYRDISRSREYKMGLQDTLVDFHSTLCKKKSGQTEKALKNQWKKYINSRVTKYGKQVAKNAMAVDFVSRTALFEAHPSRRELKQNRHKKYLDCEWSLIGLSIRNRAFSDDNVRGRYTPGEGRAERGDLVAVATHSQYNVWHKKFFKRQTDIVSCFLDPKIKEGRLSTNPYKEKVGNKPETFAEKARRIDANTTIRARPLTFEKITKIMPRVLGIKQPGVPPSDDSSYLNNIFEASMDGSFKDDSVRNHHYLKEYKHYYHPFGMVSCDLESAYNKEKILNGFLRVNSKTGVRYVPVTDGKVSIIKDDGSKKVVNELVISRGKKYKQNHDGFYSRNTTVEQDFSILKEKKWIDPKEIFGGDVVLVVTPSYKGKAGGFKEKGRVCMPYGVFPSCFHGENGKSLRGKGRLMPFFWFNRKSKNLLVSELEKLGMSHAKNNLPLNKHKGGGSPLYVRCISDGMQNATGDPYADFSKEAYPTFGGPCHVDMMLATEVDPVSPSSRIKSKETPPKVKK